MKQYYSLSVTKREADIYIFGDITTPDDKAWAELWGDGSPTSGLSLINDVKDLDVDVINVHINSYGGIVSEGLAIYNTLKNHKAKIRTVCDGFACSAASVIFMAGEERLMNPASLLMIHNAWVSVSGNASQLRKTADDIEVITSGLIEAYMAHATISREQIQSLLDAESWIKPEDAVAWGFASGILSEEQCENPAASARLTFYNRIAQPDTMAKFDSSEIGAIVEKAIEKYRAGMELEAPTPPAPPEKNMTNFFNALVGGKD